LSALIEGYFSAAGGGAGTICQYRLSLSIGAFALQELKWAAHFSAEAIVKIRVRRRMKGAWSI
jgi:hypothetical protein